MLMNKKDRDIYFKNFLIDNYIFNLHYPEQVEKLKEELRDNADV